MFLKFYQTSYFYLKTFFKFKVFFQNTTEWTIKFKKPKVVFDLENVF